VFARNHGMLPSVVLFTGLLTGCGGGGDSNTTTPNNPPSQNPGTPGDTFGITSSNRLVSFNRTTPSTGTVMAVTGLRAGENLLGIDLRVAGTPAGQLIAIGSQGGVYTIDPSSGAATMKSTMQPDPADTTAPFTSLNGTRVSIDFNNLVDQLRVVSNTGQNLRVAVDTGNTSTDAPLTFNGIGSVGVTEVTYTNNFASTCRNTVYYLDTTGDRLMTSVNASAGVLTSVGNLTVDAGAQSGFDIATTPDGNNTAFAALTVSNTTSLYTINLMTGAATVVGPISQLNSGETILGLATPPPASTPTQPVGELVALTESNKLVSFNSAFPPKLCTSQPVTGLQGGENLLSIDLRPNDGNIYGLTSSARLYTLSAATGTATFRAALAPSAGDPFTGLSGSVTADVSPGADALRVLSTTGQNLAVNMDTGAVITATALNSATVNGFSVTANSYTNSFSGATVSTLYNIDTTGDRLLTQGVAPGAANNPNGGVLNAVGNGLGIGDVQPVLGFDINALNNTALAALTVGNANSASLYSIALLPPPANSPGPALGSATLINAIGGNERIRGLTYSARRQATVLAITSDNRLVSFNPATPGTLVSNAAITGMPSSEKILGFDFRPSNGLLYILTTSTTSNQSSVYTLNPANAQAMLLSRLMPSANDPFTSLIGTAFVIDFSPPADAMRVVSDAEHNLAVVVDSGAVITTTSLTRIAADAALAAPDVVAGAYTNNYSPSPGTILYNIDIVTGRLLTQAPANNGVLASVGALLPGSAVTFRSVAGFDIAGGQDGIAVAALVPSDTMLPTLYRVNLMTGALTAVGTIGAGTTQPLIGLTVQLQ
jgi:hypothetical protein